MLSPLCEARLEHACRRFAAFAAARPLLRQLSVRPPKPPLRRPAWLPPLRATSTRSTHGTAAGASPAPGAADVEVIRARLRVPHPHNNIPTGIIGKVGRGLHLNAHHPLGQLKHRIQTYFEALEPRFVMFDRLSPIVTTAQNFDSLLTPPDHVSRRASDTYYVDDAHLLRCHMTAHQAGLIAAGHGAFLMAGDVFRRDEIDATHYPVFHQLDGVRVWDAAGLAAAGVPPGAPPAAAADFALGHLKATLEGLVRHVFGDVQSRWVDATFPFTEPSAELEISFGGRWLEVLGCGVIRSRILLDAGRTGGSVGWAFGLGLERLAMVLHDVPDIRLFWTDEPRFLDQFAGAAATAGAPPVRFRPYSKYPACYKDITFWLPPPPARYNDNDFFEVVREAGGDLVERCELLDTFTHPKTARVSKCFRVHYRSMDRSLLNAEVDAVQADVRARVAAVLGATLR